jgi:hypothetical protein
MNCPNNDKLNEECRKFEITRKCYFTLSSWWKVANWTIGYPGALLSSVGGVNVFFSYLMKGTAKKRLLYVGIPFYAIARYGDFKGETDRNFRIGAEYNILFRRLKDIRTITDPSVRDIEWRQFQAARDAVERSNTCPVPDWVHRYVKSMVERELKEKLLPKN